MIIREMTLKDIDYFVLPLEWMRDKYKQSFKTTNDPAWIMEQEGRIICAFGAVFLWDGVCEIWFNAIRLENNFVMIRMLRRHLITQCKAHCVKRLQSIVKCDYAIGKRFVEAFGFKNETPDGMKGYHPDGSSVYMYARLL